MDEKPGYMLIRPKSIAVKKPLYSSKSTVDDHFTLSLMMTKKIRLYLGLTQVCHSRFGQHRTQSTVIAITATSLRYRFVQASLLV